MNERIKELVGQAKFMAEETINKKISKNAELDAFAEKFAKLIVRECARVIDRGDGEMSSMAETSWCNICRDDILNHFGVKK